MLKPGKDGPNHGYKELFEVPPDLYKDSDVPKRLPDDMGFNT